MSRPASRPGTGTAIRRTALTLAAGGPGSLGAAELHGKRLDMTSQARRIRARDPLTWLDPSLQSCAFATRTNTDPALDLRAAYAAWTDGCGQHGKLRHPVMHNLIQFPTGIALDPAAEQRMLDHAVAFVNRMQGGDAVFAARLDRDEAGCHTVDVFSTPRYWKTTKARSGPHKGQPVQRRMIASTRFDHAMARQPEHRAELVRRLKTCPRDLRAALGYPPAPARLTADQDTEWRTRLRTMDEAAARTSLPVGPRQVGQVLQTEWEAYLREIAPEFGLDPTAISAKTEKTTPDADRLEPEIYKLNKEAAAAETRRAAAVQEIAALTAQRDQLTERITAQTDILAARARDINAAHVRHRARDAIRDAIDAGRHHYVPGPHAAALGMDPAHAAVLDILWENEDRAMASDDPAADPTLDDPAWAATVQQALDSLSADVQENLGTVMDNDPRSIFTWAGDHLSPDDWTELGRYAAARDALVAAAGWEPDPDDLADIPSAPPAPSTLELIEEIADRQFDDGCVATARDLVFAGHKQQSEPESPLTTGPVTPPQPLTDAARSAVAWVNRSPSLRRRVWDATGPARAWFSALAAALTTGDVTTPSALIDRVRTRERHVGLFQLACLPPSRNAWLLDEIDAQCRRDDIHVNQPLNASGHTVLHLALMAENKAAVKRWIANGADPHQADQAGNLPVETDSHVVQELIDEGHLDPPPAREHPPPGWA